MTMSTVFAASQLETDDQDDGLASSQGYQLLGLLQSGDTGTPDGQMLPLVDLAARHVSDLSLNVTVG